MPGAASVPRREISLPRGKHDREKHRKNCVPALRDPGIRGNSGRLHRPDAEGYSQPRLAGGVAGLEFKDEADTVNALVPELKAHGIEAIVVLIHEGGFPTGDYNECPGISGPIV